MISRILKPSLLVGSFYFFSHEHMKNTYTQNKWEKKKYEFPNRSEIISNLKNETFDILIIGGGATGSGVAYAASTRGLKVALVERYDFGSGTSCKSTKLIHGGVRYLQKAVFNLDIDEYNLVKESLNERKILLRSCPNMVTPVPILLPCSGLFDFLFKSSGIALYEMISQDKSMLPSFISKEEIKKMFPFLKMDDIYKGIIYFDGQFNDARMNLAVIKTAIYNGASACNYICAKDIIKGDGIQEVVLYDSESQETFSCKAKYIVNATGPYIDSLRKKNDEKSQDISRPSSGIHLSIPSYITQHKTGILLNEPNNRVLFVLPWEGTTIVGTTDEPTSLSDKPEPTKNEIDNVLQRFSSILDDKNIATYSNIRSCWSGIRPLVIDPKSNGETASVSRNHLIEVDENFINVSGGKWTIFRKMGEDVVKIICEKNSQSFCKESSDSLNLYNCEGWTPDETEILISEFHIPKDIAEHLSHSYGFEAFDIAKSLNLKRIHPDFPFTEEEISHICKNEYICSLEDIIARRTRLAFIDVNATKEILEKISFIAMENLGWSNSKREDEIEKCQKFFDREMGYQLFK